VALLEGGQDGPAPGARCGRSGERLTQRRPSARGLELFRARANAQALDTAPHSPSMASSAHRVKRRTGAVDGAGAGAYARSRCSRWPSAPRPEEELMQTDERATAPRESPLAGSLIQHVVRFVDVQPDWKVFTPTKLPGNDRAVFQYVGPSGHGEMDPWALPADHFSVYLLFVPPGGGSP